MHTSPIKKLIMPVGSVWAFLRTRCCSAQMVNIPLQYMLALLFLTTIPAKSYCASTGAPSQVLMGMSIEELSDIEITSISKNEIPLSKAPASLFVITHVDIRRSGANTIPEALRLAPNLSIAQINAYDYAISSRGFNSKTSNKLQVLIDGRIVYTPLYSGVFWDAQDVAMDDIDRIEVTSGPATTIWGGNAVNGVINIVTKSAKETQGSHIHLTSGPDKDSAYVRYGGTIGQKTNYRIYYKANEQQPSSDTSLDAWHRHQLGFTSNWQNSGSSIALSGDAYDGKLGQAQFDDKVVSGFNLMAQYQYKLKHGSLLRLKSYIDYTKRMHPNVFQEALRNYYMEFDYLTTYHDRHNLQWGGEYRMGDDQTTSPGLLAFLPNDKKMEWMALFAQDEYHYRENIRITTGIRVEENPYTGVEWMPTLRIAWNRSNNQLIWTSLSQAIRTPSRIDTEFFIPGEAPYQLMGNPDFESEIATTYQIGIRQSHQSHFNFSGTVYATHYDKLRSIEPVEGAGATLGNGLSAKSLGVELWGNWQVTDAWRLRSGLFRQDIKFYFPDQRIDAPSEEGNNPSWQLIIQSELNIDNNKELDFFFRRVNHLNSPAVPAYSALDVRAAWWLTSATEISFKVSNAIGQDHGEFGSEASRTYFDRSTTLGLRWLLR